MEFSGGIVSYASPVAACSFCRNNAGMSTQLHSTESDCLAISAEEAAKLLGISKRHFASLHAQGRIPRPINLGRSVRWSLPELRDWIDAGAPERSRWEVLKRGDK